MSKTSEISAFTSIYHRPHASTTFASKTLQQSEAAESQNQIEITDSANIQTIFGFIELTSKQRELLKAYYKDTITTLKKVHKCSHCQASFSLWSNVGLRGCRTHPGRYDKDVWQCCGRTPDIRLAQDLTRQLTYEPFVRLTGCVEADHLISGEEETLTPHQIDNVHNILISNAYPKHIRMGKLSESMVPMRRSPNATISLPYLLYLMMPEYKNRHIKKIVLDGVQSVAQSQAVVDNGDLLQNHPLAEDMFYIGLGTYAIDPLNIIVHISRLSHLL